MRFIHTSDWHLGRSLCGERLIDDQHYVLRQLVQAARDFRPDAVLIAGDLYDRAVPSPEAVELLDEVICELALDCGVDVLAIAGNHDSSARLRFGSRVMSKNRVHVAGSLREGPGIVRLRDADGEVAFCAVPYTEPVIAAEELGCGSLPDHDAAMRASVERIRAAVPDGRAVLVAHAFVPEGEESESERALTVGGAGQVGGDAFEGFAYVALGHLHRAQVLRGGVIRYSGSILKYAFSEESHRKSIELVEMDGAGGLRAERVVLKPRREVRTLAGQFDELVRDAAGPREDLLSVTLLDAAPILDAKLRLSEVYPNVLQVQQPNFLRPGSGPLEAPDCSRIEDAGLFAAFFEQVNGRTMTAEEAAELKSLLESFLLEQREAVA